MFGAENNFRNIKNKVFFKEGPGGSTVINAQRLPEFTNPANRKADIAKVVEEIKQKKEAAKQTPNAQFEFQGQQYNTPVYGENGTPVVPNPEVAVSQPYVNNGPRYVQSSDGKFYPVLANGDVNLLATPLLINNVEIDNAIREGAVMSQEEYKEKLDAFDNNSSLPLQEGLKTTSNTVELISNAENIPELNVSLEDAVNQLDEQLKDVTSDIFTAAEYKIFTDQPALQDNREEVKQIISETVQKQRFEKGKGALGALKNIASGFKNKAKDVWKVLDKDLTPKQVLGIVLLAGGMTAATLAALPVAAALAGGTLAGTAASYGAIGLAAGVGGNLAAAPFVASTASLVSAGIAAQGINMVRNRPKQVANVANAENSEVLTTEVSQTVETPAQAVAEVPKGFESNEFRETLNLVNLEDYSNGTELEITAIVQDKPVIAKLQVITMPNGEKGLKFVNNPNTFVSVSTVDQADEHKGTIIAGMDLKLKYLDGDGTQERTIKVDAVKITKEVVNSSQVEVVSNPESGNEKIAELANKVGEYEEALKPLKSQLDGFDKAIKAMKDAGIDTSSAEKQKAELLKGTLDKENQVSGALINLIPEIKKSQSISEQNRTPDQQKLVDIAAKAKQLGFNWVGGNEINQAALVTGPSQFGNTKTEVKVGVTESKPSVETRVEIVKDVVGLTKEQNVKLVENLNEVEKVVNDRQDEYLQDIDNVRQTFDKAGIGDSELKQIFGLPDELSSDKLDKVIATAIFIGDIQNNAIENSNLGFMVNISTTANDAIIQNPALDKIMSLNPEGSVKEVSRIKNDLNTLVRNAGLAKQVFDLGVARDKIKNINADPGSILFEDDKLEFSVGILEKSAKGDLKSEVVIDKIKEARPELAEILTLDNMRDLYNNKSNLSAAERKSMREVADLVSELLTTGKIEKKQEQAISTEVNEKIFNNENDELDVVKITVDGQEREAKLSVVNSQNGSISVFFPEDPLVPVWIDATTITNFVNVTKEKAKQDAEAKAKAEEEEKKTESENNVIDINKFKNKTEQQAA